MQSKSALTSDDKLWAAIAHASVLFSFWGPLVPGILWFLQRRKSAHVRFHALQALSYQITSFWVGMILLPVMFIAMMVAMFAAMAYAESHPGNETAGMLGMTAPFLMYLPMIAALGLYVLVGFIGAVASLLGRNFRYPFMGEPLRRKLGYEPTAEASIAEEQEDQVVAAVAHATCIIPMFGAVLPLILWITQKDRAGFIRFQSLQALVYQALGTLAYFVLWMLYMVFIFVTMGTSAFGAQIGQSNPSEGLALLLAGFAPLLCIVLVFLIGSPLYHLFGFIASLRVLRGKDYNYPLLGRYLRKRTGTPAMEAA